MKDLLEFIIKNILGKDVKFEILEEDNGSLVTLTVKTKDEDGGMIIGKQGKIIKAIRNILRIKATLEKKKIILLVNPSKNTDLVS
ncbi:MAG: hypothetical protein UR39_C0002G0174 [Candidatus Woesebacteria bacterium GW2011_GWA1_33_30]|uniref:Uncharacterized protein n=1 Tax=Candidatus Woesebacteria bacterium GW2011_GWA2_33_28 TaxID=1618561 RepID=A0A0G0A9S6_9BACT|nr:MAG: hypothetical protein UR38_C0002G0174 [Candidatus Woesebacteria bacterium GW2011_GWA2_33_28]KKP48884.1 MAG: hypothetical protein UR39_C0002G0174 [Candidatus Woesebacteria bacterium GW2011_GWA1_33_30]KKP50157.1 MAG: hypothetical protein UR40_C0002G0174 [Microgenomates group bacterium GW2011_GWC1_33_32]KKP51927.1 MAG: hypothetical protein UR44_C0006G0173 [Candidatus Woesebacteria bacterium GW2011_GWB1_33_38]KKP56979.1 MAG: hypothetical protein UR48_C0025G0011 [Microgenomates group bacteriu